MLKDDFIVLIILFINVAGCSYRINYTNKLHDQGFGDAFVGMSTTQIAAALKSEIREDLWSPPEEKYFCYYVFPNNIGSDLYIMIEEEKATRFEIHSDKLETIIGLKVGDSEESVLKLLADKLHIENHPYIEEDGKYILYKTGEDFGYLFETQYGVVKEIRSGKLSSIQYIEDFQLLSGLFRGITEGGAGIQIRNVSDIAAILFAIKNIDVIVDHSSFSKFHSITLWPA